MRFSIAVPIVFAAIALAHPILESRAPLSPDPAGVPHIGNGNGEQFITGQCLSNADCASGCCATLNDIGICSGPGASTQQGKTGCGFGGGAAPAAAPPAAAPPASSGGSGLKPDPAGVPHIGNGNGEQFITGQCLSNADCASGCCATLGDIGICSGPGASTQQGKTGCGFGGGSSSSSDQSPAAAPPAAAPPASSGLKPDPAGVPHIGNGNGEQFITGQCLSNADCASGCCATLGDIGICSGPGASTQQGKTGCGFGGGSSSSSDQSPAAAPPAAAPPASSGLKPDPAGVPHIGNGKGEQFITGQCLSNADCASACCATLGDIGICSGPGASTQQGKTGCGFGGGSAPAAAPPAAAPPASSGSGLKPDPAGVPHIGNGKGEQFITGQCLNNADCASGCCATLNDIGICSGPGAAFQAGKTGCGFSS